MTRLMRALLLLSVLGPVAAGAAPPKKGELVPDQYLVALSKTGLLGGVLSSKDIGAIGQDLARKYGGKVLLTYGNAFNGYLVRLDARQAEALRKDPLVKYLEQDSFVGFAKTQNKPAWGLDRIDQRKLPLDAEFEYPDSAGTDVRVYIIDTGIRGTHQEFKKRYAGGVNFAPGPDHDPGHATQNEVGDCNGHGTHVAGIAVGEQYGVAKRARVYGVRVLGCDGSGTVSSVVAGVDWVTRNAKRPAVANLSLGGGVSPALDDALNELIERGVLVVVAAGNDDRDACGSSPARVKDAITVAATDQKDQRASFSNWGKCVDLFAPGKEILSAWYEKDNQNATMNGTSMAAPHVAGLAALYLGERKDARPREIVRELLSDSSSDRVGDPRGSPNKLAYDGRARSNDSSEPGIGPEPGPQPSPSVLPRLPIGR